MEALRAFYKASKASFLEAGFFVAFSAAGFLVGNAFGFGALGFLAGDLTLVGLAFAIALGLGGDLAVFVLLAGFLVAACCDVKVTFFHA